MEMLQVKIPQISLIRQLVYDVAKSFTIWTSAQIETSSDLSREFTDTSCSSVAVGSRQTGGIFLFRYCAGVLRCAAD